MKKQWIALPLALCLLLGGCGNTVQSSKETSPSTSAAAGKAAAAAGAAISALINEQEAPVSAAESPTLDPKELWQMAEEAEGAAYAADYDLDMAVSIDLDGDITSQKLTGRIKEIDSQEDYRYYSNIQSLNTVTETWYGDGTVYLSDSTGDYKAPQAQADFIESNQLGSDEVLNVTADSFGTLTAQETDSGYRLSFGDVSLDAWMEFSDLISVYGDSVTCTGFTLEGTMDLDASGAMTRMDLELTAQCNVLGMTLNETVSLTQKVNSRNDAVSIDLPADNAAFRQMNDITIPETYIDGFNAMLGQYALGYESALTITVSDGMDEDAYTQKDNISYVYDEDEGLALQWDKALTVNGQEAGFSKERYANGQVVFTDEDGDTTYDYTDESYLQDLEDFLAYYSDSFDYGSDYSIGQVGNYNVLIFSVDSEYVEAVLAGNLSSLEPDIDMSEASSISSTGTASFWFDASGMLVRQKFEGTSVLQYTGMQLTLSIQDNGTVVAVGDDVTVSASA